MISLGVIRSLYDFLGRRIRDADISEAAGSSTNCASVAYRRMALYIAVSYVSRAISACEFKTYEDGESVKRDLYYALNVKPNPNQNAFQFKTLLTERLFYDTQALMVQPSQSRNEFWIADSFAIKTNELKDWTFSGIAIDDFSLKKTFKRRNVAYFALEDPAAVSVINELYQDMSNLLGIAINSFEQTNGDKYVFTRPNAPGGKRSDEINSAAEINDKLKDFIQKSNGIIPVYQGQTLERLNHGSTANGSSDDVISLRKDIFDTVAAALKIPQSLMYGNMTNVSELINQFITFGVDPVADMIGAELTRTFYGVNKWNGGKNRIVVDTSRISHVDLFGVADKVDKLIASGVSSIDEVRDPLGLDSLNSEYSSAHWMTKNYTSVENAAENLDQI